MPKRVFLRLIVASFLSMPSAHAISACDLTALPIELQQRLKTEFSSWKIQDASSLTKNARERWQSEKPLACPGIAIGNFENPTRTSYALLLVPLRNSDAAYRFVAFTPNKEAHGDITIIESFDGPGAANGFICRVFLTQMFNADWRRKLKVVGPDGILFVDAGINEYEADVYFWSDGKYHHEPIDD